MKELLAQSCGIMEVGVMKSTTDYERAGIGCFGKGILESLLTSYCSGSLM